MLGNTIYVILCYKIQYYILSKFLLYYIVLGNTIYIILCYNTFCYFILVLFYLSGKFLLDSLYSFSLCASFKSICGSLIYKDLSGFLESLPLEIPGDEPFL